MNGPGMTTRIKLDRAAERREDRSHAGAWERELSGPRAFGLKIGTLFPSRW
jgi:hypothetical protein